jgi:hypothetical protein
MDLTQKILGDLKLDYDVIEDLKNMKVNITVFELCKIKNLREQLHEALQHIQGPQGVAIGNSKVTLKGKNTKATKSAKTTSVDNKENTTMDKNQPDPKVNGALTRRKSRSQTPPFLLNFDIFNRNVHNCLVDSRALSNVMPYSVCKKLNAKPHMRKTNIIQLHRSHVKVLGELKDVLIFLSSNSTVIQTIDIIVVDILESYGVILRKYWSTKINR